MDPVFDPPAEAMPERSLAALHGLVALAIGAFVWSGAAAVFGMWALPVAPALGWLVAWSCRYGGRSLDTAVRVIAWLLSLAAVLAALAAVMVFSALQGSHAGLDARQVLAGSWALFAEPPWFGSAAVLLTLVGAGRALRAGSTGVPARAAASGTADPEHAPEHVGSGWSVVRPSVVVGRSDQDRPTSRVA